MIPINEELYWEIHNIKDYFVKTNDGSEYNYGAIMGLYLALKHIWPDNHTDNDLLEHWYNDYTQNKQ